MSPEELLKKEDLAGALSGLKAQVAANPSNGELRWFLFQLFCFCADYQRAQNQLNLAAELDKQFESGSLIYSRMMAAELLRQQVTEGKRTPLLLGEPEPWLAKLFEANRMLGEEQLDMATGLREEAFETMPAIRGKCNGNEFTWICDQDSRFAANLECFMNGKYYWVPLSQVKELILTGAPESYTDVLYPRAKLTLRTEAEMDVMLFARYPSAYSEESPALALNRLTEWEDLNDYTILGRGQRMLCSDGGDFPLLEILMLSFE